MRADSEANGINGVNGINGDHISTGASATNGHGENGMSTTNGHTTSGTTNGTTNVNGHATNGTNDHIANGDNAKSFTPIAICGMACRLPGGVHKPQDLWEFLINKRDARGRVPETRYSLSGYHSKVKKPGNTVTEYGYFLDDSIDLGALDTSFFSMARKEVEHLDPQQRILLEVARECVDDAGETGWRRKDVGVYVGSFGNDWYDAFNVETQKYGMYQVSTTHDFTLSNRVSYEMDLRGPSMTIRTACSSGLVGLNEACEAIAKGDCRSAIVGGTNLIMAPALTTAMSEQGALGVDGSCKTFSASANGYARGEAIVALYVKSLDDALREGSPIRAVISGTATNCDGKTPGFSVPSASAQETLIRHTYDVAGISKEDVAKTGFFECHGTGTQVGDPIETEAVANIFGDLDGVIIGSTKPNLGHGEGASGLTSVVKAVLALEHKTIPPNIKALPLNPKIPFDSGRLTVPLDATPWPVDRDERISVNSFGIGGANAHAIIESAASFNAKRSGTPARAVGEVPQLLVFSAQNPQSLKELTDKYQKFLDPAPEHLSLTDIAYTLANRREHLPVRSFSVGTRDQPGIPSAASTPGKKPSTVMVFTGQGAQWPQMSRELFRANATFKRTVKSLDQHLASLTSEWKIEEELFRPARTSRVNEAEFSQPLCTALQIALVDTLFSIGVKPVAVVGHSSGEIAAAYAAGALTAKEAIAIAFHRGAIAKVQARRGAMAALGLSWEEAEKHLVPGLVVACDNSPSSVTLSGDADKLETVVASVKESHPGVLASTLKVEKAYHSHHMVEVGEEYHRAMIRSKVVGQHPSVPFFSSVTGKLLTINKFNEVQLGPRYWQKNLESPVLFRSAVTSILRDAGNQISNPIFLEIGPHAALAGPLRQILTKESSTAPHIATITRKQNSAEGFLTAIGKMWSMHVEGIDFAALIPQGTTLPDLPRYPWNHQRSYWFESRVSKEWRLREHAYHDLLGARVPESSGIEPVWRNLFHLDNAPWVRDHKIKEDIIFPFAGYIAMAAEAVRQISGVQEAVELRNIAVSTALVVGEGAPTELITTFRKHRLTDSLDSSWWEFAISSYNGHTWTKHATGEIRAESKVDLGEAELPEDARMPRNVNFRKWYERVRRGGLDYGYHFTTLETGRATTSGERLAIATIKSNWHGDEANYHLHPASTDTYFQLLSTAIHWGLTHNYRQVIPASVESLTICRSMADDLTLVASGQPMGEAVLGDGICVAGNRTVMKISGVKMTPLDSNAEAAAERDIPMTARSEWVPHIDFQDLSTLVKPARDNSSYGPQLEKLGQLAVTLSKRVVHAAGREPQLPHLQKYKAWLQEQNVSSLEDVDSVELTSRMESLAASLAATAAAQPAKAILKVCRDADAIVSGKKGALEVLNLDDTLEKLHGFMAENDASDFFRCLGHTKPNLKVLELGAGTGDAMADVLQNLIRPDGAMLFSQYVYTDPVAGMIVSAKERFKGIANIDFSILDISKDPEDQDVAGQFDLIIAKSVIHETPSLSKTLGHVRKLLDPEGRLLILQPQAGLTWSKYVLGMLPAWWCGAEDGRPNEPSVSLGRWNEELIAAGFQGLAGSVLDSAEPHAFNTTMITRLQPVQGPQKRLTLLINDSVDTSKSSPIVRELEARSFEIACCTIGQEVPAGQDIVALVDLQEPFLDGIDGARFEQLKAFVGKLGSSGSGLLWVTKPSQLQVQDPRYASIIGLSRTIRSEMDIELATCEVGDFESAEGCKAVINVVERFHARAKDAEMAPDFEYAVSDGVTRANRFFPFSLNNELQVSEPDPESALKIAQTGRLNTMQWAAESSAAPKGDEVEVEIHATGLNFRDVLVAMGIIELPSKEPTFGYEASGVVRRVGPNVTKLGVGDRTVLTGIKNFSTVVTSSELLHEKLPDDMSFAEGASMPLVFMTAIYSLVDIGRLEKGQSVLIHSGCGGVGLAAIQIARMLGATIFTTVSSDDKIRYLIEAEGIPRHHIFNSRSASFVDDVMRETNGKGVDLALNSLSGELLHATWHCIAKWGTMVEIGKRDLLGMGKLDMNVFLANRSYRCVDIDQMREERPQDADRLLRAMMDYYSQGHIKPIRLDKVSSAATVAETFRYMQTGGHIGKIVVSLRDSTGKLDLGDVASVRKSELNLDASASYLLIGGLGGLGRSVAIWMVQNGARHLTFLSRSAGSGVHDGDFVHELESMGCTVQLVRGSVTNADDVTRAVSGTPTPLKGIIQMSMVLRDTMFPKMSIEDWNGAVSPKVQGTWNLHEATHKNAIELDFFVLFSSLSGILGQPGQANYAAANTFLDAFVQYRTNMGLPCTAIDVGAMEGAGYLFENAELLKKMQGTGWNSVVEEELLEALGASMLPRAPANQQKDVKSVLPIVDKNNMLLGISPAVPLSSPDASSRLRRDQRMAVYHNMGRESGGSAASSNDTLRTFLNSARANPAVFRAQETVTILAQEIGKKLFVLLLKPDQEPNIALGLSDLGLDSMIAVEMRAWWKQAFGLDISVLEMLGMGTLEALGKRVAEELADVHGG
ncbi:MAG: Type I Iterative PKS [Bathelium mastoideum]|nr:MAG: Type I Iterative PKS [Bathelium mastoideum]